MSKWPRFFWRSMCVVTRVAVLSYIGFCLLVFLLQGRMIFRPDRASLETLLPQAEQTGFLPWQDSQGQIIGWQSIDGDPEHRLLCFHGNAGHALHRGYLREIIREANPKKSWKIYILEYPGYGSRDGSPSENSFLEAAQEAMLQLQSDASTPIVIFGESLGASIASSTAAANPTFTAGVILFTPFDNLTNLARHYLPLVPVHWLLRDEFDSFYSLSRYPGPAVIVSAEHDDVIPTVLSENLFWSHAGDKLYWIIANAKHNDAIVTLDRSGLGEMLDFVTAPVRFQ